MSNSRIDSYFLCKVIINQPTQLDLLVFCSYSSMNKRGKIQVFSVFGKKETIIKTNTLSFNDKDSIALATYIIK